MTIRHAPDPHDGEPQELDPERDITGMSERRALGRYLPLGAGGGRYRPVIAPQADDDE